PSTSLTPLFPSMIPPPPSPSLFPYTTLFRSTELLITLPILPALVVVEPARELFREARLELGARKPLPRADVDLTECLDRHRLDADRKSTRLNSSHLGISYAVFCLKKKNTTNH